MFDNTKIKNYVSSFGWKYVDFLLRLKNKLDRTTKIPGVRLKRTSFLYIL